MSGNGFGQRDAETEEWGHFAEAHLQLQCGDNRSEFILPQKGHRVHHLCLWHLADMTGILSNVLNIMSAEVAANSQNVATDTAQVQRSSKKRQADRDSDSDEQKKKATFMEKKQEAFQMGVVASLSSISIAQVQESLGREEDKVREFRLKLLSASMSGDERDLYESLVDHHTSKVSKFEDEIKQIRKGSNSLLESFKEF